MIISRKLIYLCATVLTAVLSVGCSQSEGKDDPDAPGFEEGIPTEVSITLSSRSGNQTRADGKPKDPVASVEFIHDWWIAFVDSKKNVTILERKDAKNKVNSITGSSTDANANGGFEVETFKTIIPSGNYRIYAFANIPVKSADQIKEWLVKDPEDNKYKFQSKYISHFVTDPSSNPELDPKIDTKFGRGIMTWSSSENIP
ncbi:MAG: hypothetical protein K2J58_07040, partial [Muribaculaceae bacterium]|nr:hypothetical protein [Muribaculaceae bacterium]